MRRPRRILAALALAASLMPLPALADWLDDARAAFGAGDYATALALAAPRAETGDPAAQNILAVLHFHGLGMAADPARGLAYYEAAAAQGLGQSRVEIFGKCLEFSSGWFEYRSCRDLRCEFPLHEIHYGLNSHPCLPSLLLNSCCVMPKWSSVHVGYHGRAKRQTGNGTTAKRLHSKA